MINHCGEGLAIVKKDKDGKLCLIDTYWGIGDSDGYVFYPDNPVIDIKYYTNLDEIKVSSNDTDKYYNEKDVFVLTSQHGYCTHKYIRKGAKRDKDVIKKSIKKDIVGLKNEIRYKLSEIEDKKKLLLKLDENYQTMYM